MSVKSKAQLILDIQTFIADNVSEDITASDIRSVLIDIVDSLEIVGGGSSFIKSDGYCYWKKANPAVGADTVGDIREGMVGSELQLQEHNGTTWDIRSTR
jgi:hypothetical protein